MRTIPNLLLGVALVSLIMLGFVFVMAIPLLFEPPNQDRVFWASIAGVLFFAFRLSK